MSFFFFDRATILAKEVNGHIREVGTSEQLSDAVTRLSEILDWNNILLMYIYRVAKHGYCYKLYAPFVKLLLIKLIY